MVTGRPKNWPAQINGLLGCRISSASLAEICGGGFKLRKCSIPIPARAFSNTLCGEFSSIEKSGRLLRETDCPLSRASNADCTCISSHSAVWAYEGCAREEDPRILLPR